jgi:hypothetical protein
MNTFYQRLAIGAMLIGCAAGTHASDLDPRLNEFRTWTNTEGKRIRAACTSVGAESVNLMTTSGKRYGYPINGLSSADKAYSHELKRRISYMPDTATSVRHSQVMAERSPRIVVHQGVTPMPDIRPAAVRRPAIPQPANGHAAARAQQLVAQWNGGFDGRRPMLGAEMPIRSNGHAAAKARELVAAWDRSSKAPNVRGRSSSRGYGGGRSGHGLRGLGQAIELVLTGIGMTFLAPIFVAEAILSDISRASHDFGQALQNWPRNSNGRAITTRRDTPGLVRPTTAKQRQALANFQRANGRPVTVARATSSRSRSSSGRVKATTSRQKTALARFKRNSGGGVKIRR